MKAFGEAFTFPLCMDRKTFVLGLTVRTITAL